MCCVYFSSCVNPPATMHITWDQKNSKPWSVNSTLYENWSLGVFCLSTYILFFLIHTYTQFFSQVSVCGDWCVRPILGRSIQELDAKCSWAAAWRHGHGASWLYGGFEDCSGALPTWKCMILWLGSSVGNLLLQLQFNFSVMLLLLLVLTAKYSCAQVNGYMLHFILLILHPKKLLVDFLSFFWGSFFWWVLWS